MFKKLFGAKNSNSLPNAEVEKLMTPIDGEKFGTSEEMLLYGGFQELNDYYFFETLLISVATIKAKGATIIFKSKKGDFTLNSSMLEFESEYAKPLTRNATQISFGIDKNQIKKIQQKGMIRLS